MDGSFPFVGLGGLTMKPRRYSFDGEMVTVEELSLRVTCYSEPWLASALKAGCRSVMDLAVRWHQSGLRQLRGQQGGARLKRRKLQYPHLKPRNR
jgi:hypothetical protein